jgi:hypothetical protein
VTEPAAVLRVRRDDLREPVLERVVAALAARVDLPVDRLADAQLVISALVSASEPVANGVLRVEVAAGEGSVQIAVGPLRPGGPARVVADSNLPGVGTVLERLVDVWTIEPRGDAEMLRLTIGAGAAAPG